MRLFIVVAAALLLTGCAAERVATPTFDSAAAPVSVPPPPVKYTAENRKTCLDVRQEVGPELPASQPDLDSPTGPSTSAKTCVFKAAEQAITFGVQSWENTDDATGFTSGNDNAKKYFGDRTSSWEKDGGVGIGSDARWREPRASACAVEALDENAVLTVALTGGAEGEQCRAAVRELAKKFYAAMQP